MKTLDEAHLETVFRNFADPSRSVALLTAFCAEYDHGENKSRNRALAAHIRNLGYGFIFVDGHWIDGIGSQAHLAGEEAIVAFATAGDKKFTRDILELARNFGQRGVLIKDADGIQVIFSDGTEEEFSAINQDELSRIYKKIRGDQRSKTFWFDAERRDIGFIARLGNAKP